MADKTIDFDPPGGQNDPAAQAGLADAITTIASLNARAVMPDGRTVGRAEILQALGLNPNTAPTAWLNVIGCGSNASALLPGDLQRIALERLGNAANVLKQVDGLGGGKGFAAGGAAGG